MSDCEGQLALFEQAKALLAHSHPNESWSELFTALAEKVKAPHRAYFAATAINAKRFGNSGIDNPHSLPESELMKKIGFFSLWLLTGSALASGGGAEDMLHVTKVPEEIAKGPKGKSKLQTQCTDEAGKTHWPKDEGFQKCLERARDSKDKNKGQAGFGISTKEK